MYPQKNQSSEDELDGSEKEDGDGGDSSDDKHEPTYIRQALLELTGHSAVIIAGDWMASGSQVITASWDRTANLYDAETGEIITTLTGKTLLLIELPRGCIVLLSNITLLRHHSRRPLYY